MNISKLSTQRYANGMILVRYNNIIIGHYHESMPVEALKDDINITLARNNITLAQGEYERNLYGNRYYLLLEELAENNRKNNVKRA